MPNSRGAQRLMSRRRRSHFRDRMCGSPCALMNASLRHPSVIRGLYLHPGLQLWDSEGPSHGHFQLLPSCADRKLQRVCSCLRGERCARRRLDRRKFAARNDDDLSGRWPGRRTGRGHPARRSRGGTAVSNGDLNTVWNNATVDGRSASPRRSALQDLSVTNAKLLASETLPTNQIVSTSFSSKSELGLSIARTASGPVATFMGYAPGGAGYPPSPPACLTCRIRTAPRTWIQPMLTSQFYESAYTDYAFNRSVVAFGANGSFYDHPDSRLRRQQQPRRRAGAERPLLYGRQLQQRHENSAATDEDAPASRS